MSRNSPNRVIQREKKVARTEGIRGALTRHGPLCVRVIYLAPSSAAKHPWIIGHIIEVMLDMDRLQSTYELWAETVPRGTDASEFFEHLKTKGYLILGNEHPVGTLKLK